MPVERYTEQQVERAILDARDTLSAHHIGVAEWQTWASAWLSGEDRDGGPALVALGVCGAAIHDTIRRADFPAAPAYREAARIAEAADAAGMAFLWFGQQRDAGYRAKSPEGTAS